MPRPGRSGPADAVLYWYVNQRLTVDSYVPACERRRSLRLQTASWWRGETSVRNRFAF